MKKLSHPSICRTGLSPSQQKRYSTFSTPQCQFLVLYVTLCVIHWYLTSFSLLGIPTSSSPSVLNSSPSDTFFYFSTPCSQALLSPPLPQRISSHEGYTQIIANDRGHLLPSVPRSEVRYSSPFSSWKVKNWGTELELQSRETCNLLQLLFRKLKCNLIHVVTRVPPNFQPAYPTEQGRV